MQAVLIRIGLWLLQKCGAALLIVLVAVAGYALWLYVQEEGLLEGQRVERLARATAERDRLLAVQAAVEQRLAGIRAEVDQQRERVRQAEKVISLLRELESWWERWFGNREQQAANVERVRKMEGLRGDLTAQIAELQQAITRTLTERESIDGALRRANSEVAALEASRSRGREFVLRAWEQTRWYVALALGAYFLGPTVWALTLYYLFAPLLARGRPIRLGPDPAALPEIGASRVSADVTVGPGELLRIKEKFLQASDEGIARKTRFVLDWRIPFTSVACGLVELVELMHPRPDGGFRVTASNGEDPHIELAIVTLPPGASLILRPSFLAGVVQPRGRRLEIRRHWRLLRWQSWVSGQFRYFEFRGPCRLLVAGSRGVRAELLADRPGAAQPARRTNQDATIGFTPNLDYRPVRAETFWSYYRGMNPLFDDLFAGRGVFVLQETATAGAGARAGRFWATVWNGVLKVFGL